MADNQQIIVEHIVNIDTTAENIGSVNAVAGMAVQVAALAGMLPDVAAAVTLRAELLAVSRNLGKVGRVSDALPMLEGLQSMVDSVTAVLGARSEIAAVVSQLHAITALAAELDTLLATPEHAASAQHSAEAAEAAIAETATNARDARTAQLNAELAETAAKASAETAKGHEDASARSAAEAQQAADAAAAVSGLPDATAAKPGDPVIWTGEKFGMGGLDETLTSRSGVMGLSDATLADVAEIRATANGVDAKATQAQTDAAEAKTLAEGVDAKATRAAADAAEAKTAAAEASGTVSGFATRLGAAEAETGRVSVGLGQHTANGAIHTPLEDVVEIITTAVNGAMDQIRDNGTGTLPENVDTLKKLADLLADVDASLKGFLEGADPDQRMGMIQAISEAQEGVTTLLANALTRMDVVNGLYSEETTLPLSAAQGAVLREQVEEVARSADVASKPWIKIVETTPSEWPYGFRADGLVLVRPTPDGVEGADVKGPEWYIFDRVKPSKLVLTATQVRMSDGTTVQSAVGGAVAASAAAAADASAAKTLAEGVDAKATQAQTDAAEAKTLATGVDGKATRALETASAAGTLATTAQTTASAAQAAADQALAKVPDLATQTTPGIVKGSDTVQIGEDGSVNVVGGAGAPLDSPAFSGTPTAPTVEDAGDASQQIATTKFVQNAIMNSVLSENNAVIGVCLVLEGGGAGSWVRVNERGDIITVPNDYFKYHTTYSNIRTVLVDGQHMQQHNKFWVRTDKITKGLLAGKQAWWISPEDRDGFVVHPAFIKNGTPQDNIWIGTYQATDEGSAKIGSQPGKLPVAGLNFASFRTQCANRNTGGVQGFCMWNIHMLSLIQLLYLIEYQSGDSQTAIGQGRITGAILNTDAPEVAQATWRGHVGLWGNVWQMLDGFRINTSKHIEIFDSAGNENYVDTGIPYELTVTGQYVKSIYYDKGDMFDLSLSFLPKTLVSTINSATFPDKIDYNAGADNFICHVGGPTGNGDACGLFCKSMYYNKDFVYHNTGTRIAKL